MSFACESSVAVSTTGSIVMNLNMEEHRSRVLVPTLGNRTRRALRKTLDLSRDPGASCVVKRISHGSQACIRKKMHGV
jgi:hypothetical protein